VADHFVGIDISKDYFDVAVEVKDKWKHQQFSQTEKGFKAFLSWLGKLGITESHICMEATGAYWYELAEFLSEAAVQISVVNPTCIRRFAQSELKRTKTDKVDAGIIARFCRTMNPPFWQLPAPEVRLLQMLVRRVYDLTKIRRQERTRLSTEKNKPVVMDSVQRILKSLDQEIARIKRQIESLYKKHAHLQEKRRLLLSIPAVGEETANVVLTEIPSLDLFSSAKQLVAYAGLAPKEIRSGSSIRGRTRLSKTGNARLRSALFMPAVVAKDYNPLVASLYGRLVANGKPPMKAVGASMRKLLHIIFGVLKSGKPFTCKP
jgi:transposase